MNNKKRLGIGLLLFFLCIGSWQGYTNYTKTKASANKPNNSIIAVDIAQANLSSIAAGIRTTGTIQGIQEATIASKTAGRIQTLNVTDGSYLQSGQMILSLDASEIRAQIDQAEASFSQATANRDNARTNAERLGNLYKADAAARQQLDNATTQYYVYDGQVAQSSATINLYQAQLANTILTAPFSGYIFNKKVVLGDMVAPNLPLMSLVDMSKVKVEVNVGEADIAKITPGHPASFTVDAYPGQLFSGIVNEISPAADLKNRTFKVWLVCDNASQLLRAGMFARVDIIYKQATDVIIVPKDALVMRDQKPYVFTVQDDTAVLTPVIPGLEDENNIEISSGLSTGTPVIIVGHDNLKNNDKVSIRKRGTTSS